MRRLLRLVGVKAAREAPYLATEDASHFASVLAAQLTDTAANANRRNWFIQAGIPTHPPHMRPEVLPARVSVTTAPGPSARVDDGQKLLPPQEKKGGPAPPRHPDAQPEPPEETRTYLEQLNENTEMEGGAKEGRPRTLQIYAVNLGGKIAACTDSRADHPKPHRKTQEEKETKCRYTGKNTEIGRYTSSSRHREKR